MSKIFDAIKQAELSVAKRKRSEAARASVTEETNQAQTGGSGDGGAPNLVEQGPNSVVQSPNAAVQSPNTNTSLLPSGVSKRDGATLMSKVFDAVQQAELSIAERKRSETAEALVPEDTQARTGGSGDGGAPNLVEQSPKPVVRNSNAVVQSPSNLSLLQAGNFNQDTNVGGAAKAPGGVPGAVARLIDRGWPWRKARSEEPQPGSVFGDLGKNLESAHQSPYWQFFHLEQTHEKNGVHRFQPSRPELQSRCYLDVAVSAKNEMTTLTLGAQRAFINGADEPYARDLIRSFLCVVFPKEKFEAINRFVDELGTEFGGSRPAGVAEGARRPAPVDAPSPLYLVFLGQGKRCAVELGALVLEEENVSEESMWWLYLRVRPRPTRKKKRFGKSVS